MNIKNYIITVLAVFVLVPQPAFAVELKAEILMCATTKDSVKRFSCYDAIGKKLLALEKVDAVRSDPEPASSTNLEPLENPDKENQIEAADNSVAVGNTLPEELGGKQFQKVAKGSKQKSQVLAKARVTACRKAIDDKWFFFFENGQIWKQVGSSRRMYRNCDFIVTIKKDGIGFKIQVEGEKRSTRVKRHR